MKTKIFSFLMFTLITLTGCNKKSAEGAESAGVDFLQTHRVKVHNLIPTDFKLIDDSVGCYESISFETKILKDHHELGIIPLVLTLEPDPDGVVPEIRFYGEWGSASGFSEIITQVQQVLVDDYGPGILLTTATGEGIYLLEQGYSGGVSFDEFQLKIFSWNRDMLNDAEERAQIK